jgi:predicted RNA binding protein YcfA (HicA-like mRNA interferase family)
MGVCIADDHRPRRGLMPPVSAVRGSQVVSALEKAGFAAGMINGSHHIMRHPDGRRTSVPVPRVVTYGLAR